MLVSSMCPWRVFWDLPRSEDWPGIVAITDGWLNEWVTRLTVMAELAAAMLVTVLKSQVAAWVPVVAL